MHDFEVQSFHLCSSLKGWGRLSLHGIVIVSEVQFVYYSSLGSASHNLLSIKMKLFYIKWIAPDKFQNSICVYA